MSEAVKNRNVRIKKPTTLLNIYYFTSIFQGISLLLNFNALLLFRETGFINKKYASRKFILSAIFSLIFFSQKAERKTLSRDKTRNHLFRDVFYKETVGESGSPSLLQNEKHGSSKSDISKVLFSGIGKITNQFIGNSWQSTFFGLRYFS